MLDVSPLIIAREKIAALAHFGRLGDRARCGECGRQAVPHREDGFMAVCWLYSEPEDCSTCSFLWRCAS